MLTELFPSAQWIDSSRIDEGLAACADASRVLVIPAPSTLSMQSWPAVRNHLENGQPALFIGRDPFGRGDRSVSSLDELGSWAATSRELSSFSSVASWQRRSDSDTQLGSVKLARDGLLPWPGISVAVEDFESCHFITPQEELSPGAIDPSENTLLIHVRGGPATSRLVLESEDHAGVRRYCVLPLSDKWRLLALHQSEFRKETSGESTADFSFSNMRRLSIGLFSPLAPQPPGSHLFEVSDIRFACDPRPVETIKGEPDLPPLSPSFRRYNLRAESVISLQTGRRFAAPFRLQSSLPRPRGLGGDNACDSRWIPLFRAVDEHGDVRGWPASLHVEPKDDGRLHHWGWIGVDPSEESRESLIAMIAESVSRLSAGLFLHTAGATEFTLNTNSTISVSAAWLGRNPGNAEFRIAAELEGNSIQYAARRVSAPNSVSGELVEINLGRAPRPLSDSEEFTLTLLLEDTMVHGKVYDRLSQKLKLLPQRRDTGREEWITTANARFIFLGRPIFLLGLDYSPCTVNGRGPKDSRRHWLDSSEFDPELVRRDLDAMDRAGVNAVWIDYMDEAQAPQLRYFIDEARRHSMWVVARLAHLDAASMDVDKAKRLVEAADLASTPQVFAVDIAGLEMPRDRLDPVWRQWLIEQYESFEQAERAIGRPLWRDALGRITGPSDKELATDGEHRGAVAVYRRFAEDFIGRHRGRCVRLLRSWGLNQLVTARSPLESTVGANGCLPVDPLAGAVHLDFLSPGAAQLRGSLDQFHEAGFITAYCRGVSDNKPVVWTEFGADVGLNARQPDLDNQARIYANVFDMVIRSRAAGCFGSRFPAGYDLAEGKDNGVVSPDGQWRPAGEVFRGFLHRLRMDKGVPAAWRGREVDPSANARGLPALWDQWRKTYRRETADGRVEEVRLAGFNKRSGEVTIQGLGGAAHVAPAPIKGFNSEWGAVEVDGVALNRDAGKPLSVERDALISLELINTGPVLWDAAQEGRLHSIWVSAHHPSQERPQLIPVPALRYGSRAQIRWAPPLAGVWRLRPFIAGIGQFGEGIEIHVVDQ